ncbi:MAG: polyprenyl synthetase family protein [Ignavibacteria bacterium]|nr:polyprenyl synthetase family protein [Ignavibacteria bacterium]
MSKALSHNAEVGVALKFAEPFRTPMFIGSVQASFHSVSAATITTLPTDFTHYYAEYKTAVEATLKAALQRTEPKNLLEPMRHVLSNGGKRIRPILTMLACGAVGGNPFYATMGGVVIEVLHNFTLVHDDIMDAAPLRRGLPTIHTQWNTSVAILSGDAMMAVAYQLLLKHYAHIPRFAECADLVTRAILEICEGQVYDMEFQERDYISMAEYTMMIEKKTARMLELCATLGTVLGNGSAQEFAALKTFARSVGIAFQILDDILDATADAAALGKTIGGDIIEGKKTFLITHALEHRASMNSSDNALLDEFLQGRGLQPERAKSMIALFERNGTLQAGRDAVAAYTAQAHRALEALPTSEYRTMLHHFSTMLLERCY